MRLYGGYGGELFLMYFCVVFLEGFDGGLALCFCFDASCGCGGGGWGCDVGDSVFDGRLSDVGVVVLALSAGGCVDDQVDLFVGDGVGDVGASFVHFANLFGGDAVAGQPGECAACGEDLEAEFGEASGGVEDEGFVGVIDGDEDRAVEWEGLLCGFLCLVECQAVGVGHAEDLSGGAHFGAEEGVHFGEHIEGEDGFFDAEVVVLCVFETHL